MRKTPNAIRLLCAASLAGSHLEAVAVRWLEAAAPTGTDANPVRKFEMVAYTGVPMMFPNQFDAPVIIDIAGIDVGDKARPILRDHMRSMPVGHTEEIVCKDNQVTVRGVISGASPATTEIVKSSLNGFPWQASVGVDADKSKIEFVADDQTAEVNGTTVEGPVYIARATKLKEVSFVALGADDGTSATVTAKSTESSMTLAQYVASFGLLLANLSPEQVAKFEAKFKAETPGTAKPTPAADPKTIEAKDDPVAQLREKSAAEMERISKITSLQAEYKGDAEVCAKAIRDNWSTTQTELEFLRASRANVERLGSINANAGPKLKLTTETISAAACLSVGMNQDRLQKIYKADIMAAAGDIRVGGLRDLCILAAQSEGRPLPMTFGDGTEFIRASFSTTALGNILENVLGKKMLLAYEAMETVGLKLAKVSPVNDFKQVARYRLLGTGGFEVVTNGGELKSGTLSDVKYTNQADTYGQILTITRKDIINDDLGALMDVPQQMGIAGAALIDELFFANLLGNAGSFFSSGNKNLLTGASSAFGDSAMTSLLALFRKIKAGPAGTNATKNAKPINIQPKFLLVPVELEMEAKRLVGSDQVFPLGSPSSITKVPTVNVHKNKYEVVSAPHISDSNYTGNSATQFWLLADPNLVPAVELVFLNGKQAPTIERVDTLPNQLGMSFRGYFDVGANLQDFRGAARSDGV